MPTSIDDIELRSEEVQHILRKPPPSLVRWGMVVVFLALSVAVVISLLVHYPSKVAGPIVLQSSSDAKGINGEIRLSQDLMKDIQRGQTVRIRLDLYPSEDFGVVTGTVKDIAATINPDKTVSVNVGLLKPPVASMTFKNGMTGSAEIITGNQSMAAKLLGFLQ